MAIWWSGEGPVRRPLAGVAWALALVPLAATADPAAAPLSALAKAGERIYREGLLSAGQPVRAELFAGVPLPPARAACITCHRASGMGSIEGLFVVPAVTGAALYRPGAATAVRFGQTFDRRLRRPAYDDATLARALRDGVDAAGRPIEPPMPRFALGDEDMAALAAYLKVLASEPAPGVTEREIHLATVVTDGIAEDRRRALVDVLQAAVAERNAGSRSESRETSPGVWQVRERRQWRLHVWHLDGPPAAWPAQLAASYQRQPVFAVVGGLAAGSWQPIHDFCEATRLPCVFPSTELPAKATGAYSLYLHRGMDLEAKVLARFLAEAKAGGPVLQVYDDDPRGVAAAEALRETWRRPGRQPLRQWRVRGRPDAAFWRSLLRGRRDVTLVLWLGDPDLQALAAARGALGRVVVSSTLTQGRVNVPAGLDGRVMSVHPFALPEQKEERSARLRAWLGAKGVAAGDEDVQSDAYFAASVAGGALAAVGDVFSREYFLERIEDIQETAAPESRYPRVSFGPGQRHASKGAYMLVLPVAGAPRVQDWVLP